LGDPPAAEFHVPTFRNTKFIKSISKRRRTKFRRQGIPQTKNTKF